MSTLHDLPTPALLLDLDRLEANLARMAARGRSLGVALRPHAKTHKSVEVATRQRAHGIAGLTVSTLYEAATFADHGFDDITWAFPLILGRIPEAAALARRITLRLVVDSRAAVDALEQSGHRFHVLLKVDSGYHRAGVDPQSAGALELARRLSQSQTLAFDGILSHSGNSYHSRSGAEAADLTEEDCRVMAGFAKRLRDDGIALPIVSVGSTPSLMAARRLDGATEARPGNYVFFDYTQTVIGSCAVTDCALTVLASVVSAQPGTNHSVVDAGALALSKDPGPDDAPRHTMGEIVEDYRAGTLRADVRVVGLSQEHGIVSQPLPVGSRIRILPNHACLTAAHWDEYHVVRGDEVVDRWKIWRGRS